MTAAALGATEPPDDYKGVDWDGTLPDGWDDPDAPETTARIQARLDGRKTLRATVEDATAVLAAQFGDDPLLDDLVQYELRRKRAKELAHELATPSDDNEPFGTFADTIDLTEGVQWRAEGLLVEEGRLLLVAQRKTGKTTIAANFLRAVQRGEHFLGRFECTTVEQNVGYLNFEVNGKQTAQWLKDVGVDLSRCWLSNRRGRSNPFNDQRSRQRLIDELRTHKVEVLVVDPFAKAFTGVKLDDTGEVTRWCAMLDEVATEAGVRELVLTNHTGWDKERGRNSTVLEDWADTVAIMVRDDADNRYLRALGRDVEVSEDRLDFDPTTRLLVLSGDGSRGTAKKAARGAGLDDLVRAHVTAHPGESQSGIAKATGKRRADVAAVLDRLEKSDAIRWEGGSRNAHHYYPNNA